MSESHIEKHRKEQIEGMRKRTGDIQCDPLEGLLYTLMRDHVTPGVIESLVIEATAFGQTRCTNGYLAQYSKDVVARLRSACESSTY